MVKPLHKNGDTENIQNCRPKSLLSVFSKILGKLMYARLIVFITKSNILTEAENGFREGKEAETAIRGFVESIQEAIDKEINLIGILEFSLIYQKI